MPEFFITARTFAAPIFSDSWDEYVVAEDAETALREFAAKAQEGYAGLYAAEVWASADDYHKRRDPLFRWLSNSAAAKEEAMKTAGGMQGHGPGSFTVFNGDEKRTITVERPMEGRVVPA